MNEPNTGGAVRAFAIAIGLALVTWLAIELAQRAREQWSVDAEVAARRALDKAMRRVRTARHLTEQERAARNRVLYEAHCILEGIDP